MAYMFHLLKHRGIRQKGHDWAAPHIQLEKDLLLNIVTSYVKHGWEIEPTHTLEQVQDYIRTFNVPWMLEGGFQQITRGIDP